MKELLSRTKLAKVWGCTEQSITDRVKNGMPQVKRGKTPKYDVESCILWKYRRDNGVNEEDVIDYNVERARKTKEEADRLERERLRDEGETLNTNDVIEWVKAGDQKVRTKLLSIPSRCAPLVTGQKVAETENILEGIIHETLQELSDPVELPDCCKV
jgi:phage terminase Nu1 subunit (DNA packaging protein)